MEKSSIFICINNFGGKTMHQLLSHGKIILQLSHFNIFIIISQLYASLKHNFQKLTKVLNSTSFYCSKAKVEAGYPEQATITLCSVQETFQEKTRVALVETELILSFLLAYLLPYSLLVDLMDLSEYTKSSLAPSSLKFPFLLLL